MRRKILIAFVILLAMVFVLCLAYATALHAKQAELADTAGQTLNPTESAATDSQESIPSSKTEAATKGAAPGNETAPLETMAPTMTEPAESTAVTTPSDTTAATETTEPPQEETQAPTQETAPATEESMDPNELPIIPNV